MTACRDMHNERCEAPSELCCNRCEEVAHTGLFPHADGSACVLQGLTAGPDLALLRDIQYGTFWQTMDGQWRHNTRQANLTDNERAGLKRWATCEPGKGAHLSNEGYDLLFPIETT
ncbi:hypothetical protein [Actinoplanes sp. NPDC051494]|uniref:hypothetical protein n=1 Tax=Actinoplanes sp. NPDC051494 TaxID=3363907 RepID=UPI0037922A95